MYGVRQFDAILNLPEVAILAVGAAEKRPVVVGRLRSQVGTVMTVTLTADHRAVDGAMAAEFLRTLKGLLEEPASMLLVGIPFRSQRTRRCGAQIISVLSAHLAPSVAQSLSIQGTHGIRLRHRRDRRRAGRLRGGDPRRAARQASPLRRARQARRHLPELGLHPDQGAADQRPPGRADQEPRQGVRLQRPGDAGISRR